MRTRQITVLQRHYNQHADGYLVLGKRKNVPPGDKNHYTVAWVSRHAPTIDEHYDFPAKGTARREFNKMVARFDLPTSAVLDKDWQQQKVYDWEDKYLYPHAPEVTEAQARKIIRRVARDYGIAAPKLNWRARTNYSDYDEDNNAINFGHRELVILLHELAHAIHLDRIDGEASAAHAPGFVWTEIELLGRYAGIDLQYMISTALKEDLLGDLTESQYSNPLSSGKPVFRPRDL